MKSVEEIYRISTVGVVLTGMGPNGTVGVSRIKNTGGKRIVKDENTNLIFGIPRSLVE
ncbi:MAG: hypothetical protein JSU58_00585 [Dehalococcoidales bacterium]|nr:MAG: hypothetical protein JSU58_00585 [Dehalococcoidales bacterium]